jgi:carnitine 3-dehydrogenase
VEGAHRDRPLARCKARPADLYFKYEGGAIEGRRTKLFAEIDDATPPDSIIASSSSGITMSVIQSGCKRPERCVIGHPFNRPHMIPLVEVVGGDKTSPEAIQQAMAFYASIGKKPIYLRKEFPGHAANRLQAALYREVVYHQRYS